MDLQAELRFFGACEEAREWISGFDWKTRRELWDQLEAQYLIWITVRVGLIRLALEALTAVEGFEREDVREWIETGRKPDCDRYRRWAIKEWDRGNVLDAANDLSLWRIVLTTNPADRLRELIPYDRVADAYERVLEGVDPLQVEGLPPRARGVGVQ